MADSDTVKRIELPSGGWWEIETRPTFRQTLSIKATGDGRGRLSGVDVFGLLVTLTTAWSFDDPVSADIFLDLKADDERLEDLIPVMAFFEADVLPFLAPASQSNRNQNGSSSRSRRAKSRSSTNRAN